MAVQVLVGDVRERLETLPDQSVQCCVTSPPYYGLRDYGVPGQLGLEPTLAEYIANMVAVFRDVRRVLRDDGTLFLNVGDSYFGSSQTGGTNSKEGSAKRAGRMFSRDGDAHGYGTSGRAGSSLSDRGSTSGSLDGGHTDVQWLRMIGSDARRVLEQVGVLWNQSRGSMEELLDHLPTGDCSAPPLTPQSSTAIRDLLQSASHGAGQLLDALESTSHESSLGLLAASTQAGPASAFRWSLRSFALDAQEFVHRLDAEPGMLDCMTGIASPCEVLASHIRCTLASGSTFSSWLNTPYVQPQCTTFKPKDLMMVPARLAIALQDDGWYLRSDIIWHKPNPMPESVIDRPTSAHEHIFLLTKQARYYYDAGAIREPLAASSVARLAQDVDAQEGSHRANGGAKTNGTMKAVCADKQRGHGRRHAGFNERWDAMPRDEQQANGANARNVWTIATKPFSGAHFATFPPEIPRRCIKAGSKPGDTVLDPFLGSGTTLLVADQLGRECVGIEINPAYAAMAERRIRNACPMFSEVAVA